MAREAFPVEEAILGAILMGAGHGYAIKRELSSGLGPVWRIAPSRLYHALARLEAEGLVRGRTEPQPGRPPRRVFTITPAGEEAFWDWVTAPVRHLRDVRVEFLAKLYFLHRLAPERMKGLIDDEIEILERTRARLSSRRGLGLGDELLGRFALSFRLGQLQATIDWLRNCAQELEKEKR